MKDLLARFNPAFDHRNRLAIMSLLVTNERIDYNTLRQTLDLTDGNLASHLKPLEQQEYIQIYKVFIGKKPQTSYAVTEKGATAFQAHLNALETLINFSKYD